MPQRLQKPRRRSPDTSSSCRLTSLESLGRAKAKIEAEYQQAVAKTTNEIANQVVAKKITASEGDTLMQLKIQSLELKKQVEIREAERAREKEIQMVGDQLNFYKELGELSGQYGNQLDMQVKLIELQASKYEDVLKIPKDLVEQWKKYKLLQESFDPWDGAYRGLVKFTAEYSNEAKQWESLSPTHGLLGSTTRPRKCGGIGSTPVKCPLINCPPHSPLS